VRRPYWQDLLRPVATDPWVVRPRGRLGAPTALFLRAPVHAHAGALLGRIRLHATREREGSPDANGSDHDRDGNLPDGTIGYPVRAVEVAPVARLGALRGSARAGSGALWRGTSLRQARCRPQRSRALASRRAREVAGPSITYTSTLSIPRARRCAKLRALSWGTFLLLVLPILFFGVLAGRFPRLLILVVLPIPISWIWYHRNYLGPNDDVTGVVATLSAVFEMGIFLAAAAVSWLARHAWRRARSGNDVDL
jgi:hypothetical protein